MTVGKGIGGGLAVSAVVGRSETMSHWPAGTHTSTFMGNAVNLAAGRPIWNGPIARQAMANLIYAARRRTRRS